MNVKLLSVYAPFLLTLATDPSDHVMFLLGEGDGEDGQPHQLFCELDELWHDATGSGETEWREAAR